MPIQSGVVVGCTSDPLLIQVFGYDAIPPQDQRRLPTLMATEGSPGHRPEVGSWTPDLSEDDE